MNTDNFTIDSSDIELAQDICKLIADSEVRNRAVANAVAGKIAEKYFDAEEYSVDSSSGLHNIGIVLQDIDISDIYINDAYIDVRVFFDEEEIVIPAEHIEHKLLPAAYMFIKITPDLAGASVIGFLNPEHINKDKLVDGYYKIEEADLVSFYDIEALLPSFVDDSVIVEDKDIFAYLDNTIDDKNAFYALLLKSKDGRLRLAKAAKAQNIFKYVSISSEYMNNSSSNLFGNTEEKELVLINDLDGDTNSEELVLDNSSESSAESFDDILSEDFIVDSIEEVTEDSSSENEEVFEEDSISELTEEDLEKTPEIDIETIEGNQDSLEEVSAAVDTDNRNEIESSETQDDQFEYSTVTSPSYSDDILDNLSEDDNNNTESEAEEAVSKLNNNSEEQIEALFNNGTEESEETSPGMKVYSKKQNKKNSPLKSLLILTLLILAGAAGYTGYMKFLSTSPSDEKINSISPETKQLESTPSSKLEDAMPIETVDSTDDSENLNEAISTSIPAIEQNLDASILVSNLKVDWEVPAGYASNTSAKRYLVKLGKIIQLNLKTELLLLSKPPITNKIAVEIKYNSGSRKFEATGVTISSGEKSVDDLILQTVNKALAMNLSMNTDSFAKLQGNPVLIIHL